MYSTDDHEESLSLLPFLRRPVPNRGRRSCARVCDSEGEVRGMEAWSLEELGPGGGRSATWAGYVWTGSPQTVVASGSSLQKKKQTVGCHGHLLADCFLAALVVSD